MHQSWPQLIRLGTFVLSSELQGTSNFLLNDVLHENKSQFAEIGANSTSTLANGKKSEFEKNGRWHLSDQAKDPFRSVHVQYMF